DKARHGSDPPFLKAPAAGERPAAQGPGHVHPSCLPCLSSDARAQIPCSRWPRATKRGDPSFEVARVVPSVVRRNSDGLDRRDARHLPLDDALDACLQRHQGHRAAAAGAHHAHLRHAVFRDVDQLDIAAVHLDRRPDLIQCLLHLGHQFDRALHTLWHLHHTSRCRRRRLELPGMDVASSSVPGNCAGVNRRRSRTPPREGPAHDSCRHHSTSPEKRPSAASRCSSLALTPSFTRATSSSPRYSSMSSVATSITSLLAAVALTSVNTSIKAGTSRSRSTRAKTRRAAAWTLATRSSTASRRTEPATPFGSCRNAASFTATSRTAGLSSRIKALSVAWRASCFAALISWSTLRADGSSGTSLKSPSLSNCSTVAAALARVLGSMSTSPTISLAAAVSTLSWARVSATSRTRLLLSLSHLINRSSEALLPPSRSA